MQADSLYRVSLKCFIQNAEGRVLVVKETGRGSWDLPGGGIDHGETIESSIRRELQEEVAYTDEFTYEVLAIEDPVKLQTRDIWSIRVVVNVLPATMNFSAGEEADEIAFMDPATFRASEHTTEQKIYQYKLLTEQMAHK